jgi:hypothetical protein
MDEARVRGSENLGATSPRLGTLRALSELNTRHDQSFQAPDTGGSRSENGCYLNVARSS